jgi:hypothetical protein
MEEPFSVMVPIKAASLTRVGWPVPADTVAPQTAGSRMAWNPLQRFGKSDRDASPRPAPAEPEPAREAQHLVPGRACGECTVCCKELPILSVEMKKPAGVLCEHCVGTGCGIYDSRPPVCRGFICAWRNLDNLEDIWRPDRCGIMVTFVHDGIPPAYSQHMGIQFHLFRDSQQVVTWEPFVGYVTELIRHGMPVFLLVSGPPGFEAGQIFLNDHLITAVALRDYGRIIIELSRAAASCESVAIRSNGPA